MGPVRVRDFDDVLARLKAKGVYTIALIVVFKDDVLARHRRHWAITDTRTGALWLDAERLAWLDPFEEEAWAYAIAVVRGRAQGIRRDPVRLPALPDGRHVERRTIFEAQHAGQPPSGHHRVPDTRTRVPLAHRRVPRRRLVRLHRLQPGRHRSRAASRGTGAARRLPLPDGVPVRVPSRHPGSSESCSPSLRGRLRDHPPGPRALGADARSGTTLDPGFPGLRLRSAVVACRRSEPRWRRRWMPGQWGGCYGMPRTATRWTRWGPSRRPCHEESRPRFASSFR